ncbi:Hypothetical protein PENO1_071890 [Penicillium occitanis (nom. inval.)]|nr:Hypothetical protein PENO1_071890 [Penicillium occitanis (nom. inval.)]PCG95968.1 hypothetical protein PENOC_075110 [Penicillium occitanis (nom. inval.)]
MTETNKQAEMSTLETQPSSLPAKPETNPQPTSNQLIKTGSTFPGPSLTGFGVQPPTAPRLMLTQGAGFSSFSTGPSPWMSQQINQKSPWTPEEADEKDSQGHTVKPAVSTGQDLQGQCARLAASMSVEKTVERKVEWKPARQFRGYDDADYASPEEGEIRSRDDTSASHATDREGRLSPVGFNEVSVNKGPQLSEVDLRSLSPKLVLFYFGVLRLQDPQLDPVVEYTKNAVDGRFYAKLTMYRDSLKIPAQESMADAKVELCRVALSILKVRYANWKVPDEPSEKLTPFSWRWAQLLQAYTEDMKHPSPELTRYVHKNGFRYQVDVGKVDTGIVTSLGHRKFYETEDQAIEAASHEVLYLLLIQELQELQEATIAASWPEHENMPTLASQLPAPTTDSLLPAKVEHPSISNSAGSGRDFPKPVNDRVLKPIHSVNAPHRVTKAAHQQSKRSNACEPSLSTLSNLVPVTNPRISTEKRRDEHQPDRKWKASPDELKNAIAKLQTSRQKYERVCSMLGLTSKIEFHENVKKPPAPSTFTVWATFQNEPFLTRAGPVGLITKYPGTRSAAEERCCQKVVDYLLNMVQEDYELEDEEMEERWNIDNFEELRKKELRMKATGMDIDSI